MATMARRRTGYRSYGNVAYDLDYMGNVAVEEGFGEQARQPQPLVRPRERVKTRTKVQVREQQSVSLFAITGFLAVAAVAVLVLMSYVQLDAVNADVVSLRSELSSLEKEEARLLAQYEQAYDLNSIEASLLASGTMTKPSAGQIVYMDLSEPDSVTMYNDGEGDGLVLSAAGRALDMLASAVEYFR